MVKKLLLTFVTASVLIGANVLACDKGTYKKNVVRHVVKAVSQTGLSAAQTKKIADGIAEYRATMREIKEMQIFPIDSFIDDNFDEKRFISEMSEKYMAKIAAEATLFKYVFANLDKEQVKIFKRAYAAPLIKKMINMDIGESSLNIKSCKN